MSRALGSGRRASGELPILSGGRLCLDFANSLDDRTEAEPTDHLSSYDALLAWSRHAGALTEEEEMDLQAEARRNASAASRALSTATAAREAIYTAFTAVTGDGRPSAAELEALNRVLRRIGGVPTLDVEEGHVRLDWRTSRELSLDTPTQRALHSSIELLTGPEVDQVRQCAAPDCSFLFLDLTRNHSRRWCRPEACGVRNRFRRYYARRRTEP
jgi:predicted RNA-binding Zn ribbon-like protein